MLKMKLYLAAAILGMLTLVAGACAQPALTPAPTPTPSDEPSETETPTTTPAPALTGEDVNFRFLISDDVNAIDDFEHIYVTISEIGVQRGGESGNWLEFTPDITEVDLKPLVGENALEIWSGNLTQGEYSKVFIYVSEIKGILIGASENETANVKLPSEKLQISKPFVISANTTTSFVYDVTVVKAGKSGQYILKPQISQSGADQKFEEIEEEKDEELEFEGTIEDIDGSTWTMTIDGETRLVDVSGAVIEGEPAEGARAEVEGVVVDDTIIASEVKIKEVEEEEESVNHESIEVSCDEFINAKHITKEVEVNAGDSFKVTLCSNPTTGFEWSESAQIGDQTVIEQVKHRFAAPKNKQLAGAAGQEIWTFRALKEGTTTISMEYSQPWEGGTKVEWTFELTVVVK